MVAPRLSALGHLLTSDSLVTMAAVVAADDQETPKRDGWLGQRLREIDD